MVTSTGQQTDKEAVATAVRRAEAQHEAGLALFYAGLSRRSLKCRFHCEMNGLPASHIAQLSRLSRLDSSQVQTFVALDKTRRSSHPAAVIGHGGWRLDGQARAEFALVVADAHQGHGVGPQLLQALIASAREQGLHRLHAYVLRDNVAMLRMLRRARIAVQDDPDDSSLMLALVEPQTYQRPCSAPLTTAASQPLWAGWRAWLGSWTARSARGAT